MYSFVMHYPVMQSLILARMIETLGCRNKFGKLRLYNVDYYLLNLTFTSLFIPAVAATDVGYFLKSQYMR